MFCGETTLLHFIKILLNGLSFDVCKEHSEASAQTQTHKTKLHEIIPTHHCKNPTVHTHTHSVYAKASIHTYCAPTYTLRLIIGVLKLADRPLFQSTCASHTFPSTQSIKTSLSVTPSTEAAIVAQAPSRWKKMITKRDYTQLEVFLNWCLSALLGLLSPDHRPTPLS